MGAVRPQSAAGCVLDGFFVNERDGRELGRHRCLSCLERVTPSLSTSSREGVNRGADEAKQATQARQDP